MKRHKLEPGDKVKIKSGKYKGYIGYIDHQAVEFIFDQAINPPTYCRVIPRGLWVVNVLRPELLGGYATYTYRTKDLVLV